MIIETTFTRLKETIKFYDDETFAKHLSANYITPAKIIVSVNVNKLTRVVRLELSEGSLAELESDPVFTVYAKNRESYNKANKIVMSAVRIA